MRTLALAVALVAGATATAKEATPSVLHAILFYGQSNAGAGGTAKSVLTSPASENVLTFATVRQVYGAAQVDPNLLRGTAALTDNPVYPPFPATAMGHALARLAPAAKGDAYFFNTVWYGGQALGAFQRDTTSWSDLMTVADRFARVAEQSGRRPQISALVFIQGESGPSDRRSYAAGLSALLADTLPALRKATGQSEHVPAILLQTNAPASGSAIRNDSDLAQTDVAAERPQDTTLAGPMYQFPLDANIHQTAEGRMMLGELLARVYAQVVVQKRPFQPLHPTGATREGGVITLRFRRPEGSSPLRWDESWVPASPDYGFVVESGGRRLPIASIEIADADSVRITLAEKPQGALRILYAQGQPTLTGWASGRGQLVSDTRIASAFHAMGYKLPKLVSDYCVRFALDVE